MPAPMTHVFTACEATQSRSSTATTQGLIPCHSDSAPLFLVDILPVFRPSLMADVAELIDLFVALADVYDATMAALNNASEIAVAVPLADALRVPPAATAEYPERSELLRLDAMFGVVSTSTTE